MKQLIDYAEPVEPPYFSNKGLKWTLFTLVLLAYLIQAYLMFLEYERTHVKGFWPSECYGPSLNFAMTARVKILSGIAGFLSFIIVVDKTGKLPPDLKGNFILWSPLFLYMNCGTLVKLVQGI